MKNHKYKILVLSDLTTTTENTLKSSANLAKMVNGTIDFFCVKKPTDIVGKESQLSAMRTINEEYFATAKSIEKIIKPISDVYEIKINHNHAFGNVKKEIGDYILTSKPDIIVIGKRKSKILGILGDNITDFVLKTFNGIVMIASHKNSIDISKNLSFGLLNKAKTAKNKAFINNLISVSSNPPKIFKIYDKSNLEEVNKETTSKENIEYAFEKGNNAIKNISNYLTKSKTNLVFLERGKDQKDYNVKEVIYNLDCSLILTN